MRIEVKRGGTVKLSERLLAVAGMVTEGNIVCDIGCDHGFVSIYLIQKGISPRVIAMDVNSGPLRAAGEHVREYGLTGYIETRLSDGVRALGVGEADTLICAGMGGRLIKRILEEGKEKVRAMKELVLQPQSEIQKVRSYLRKEGCLIVDENMILEEGKYYPVIKAIFAEDVEEISESRNVSDSGMERKDERTTLQDMDWKQDVGKNRSKDWKRDSWRQVEDKYGPILLKKRNPTLKTYLLREHDLCMQIRKELYANGNGKEKRQEEIAERIAGIEMALACYEHEV